MDSFEAKRKIRAWEVEQELEQLKAQMRHSQSQTNYTSAKYNSPANDKNKVFYQILEIKPAASQSEIKQAYKSLVKKWHPDLFFNNPKLQLQAQEKIKKINEAYKNLSY